MTARLTAAQRKALTQIKAAGEALTKRQLDILTRMAAHPHDEDGELVYERGVAFLGDEPIAARTVFALLRACTISLEDVSAVGSFERYRINETGRAAARVVKEGR